MTDTDDATAAGDAPTGPQRAADSRPDLVYRVDGRPAAPDRVTVFPADATGDELTASWLTVNLECVVTLECHR